MKKGETISPIEALRQLDDRIANTKDGLKADINPEAKEAEKDFYQRGEKQSETPFEP